MKVLQKKAVKKVIVLVEDGETQREFMKSLIEEFSSNIEVIAIENGRQFADVLLIGEREFHAVLTDFDYREFTDLDIGGVEDGVDLLKVLQQKYGLENFVSGIYSQINLEVGSYLKSHLPEQLSLIHQISKDSVSKIESAESFAGLFSFIDEVAPQTASILFEIPDFHTISLSELYIILRIFVNMPIATLEVLGSSKEAPNEIGLKNKEIILPNKTISLARTIVFRQKEIGRIPHHLRLDIGKNKMKSVVIEGKDIKIRDHIFHNLSDKEVLVRVHCIALDIITKFESDASLNSIKLPFLGPFENYLSSSIILLLNKKKYKRELKDISNKILNTLKLPLIEEFYWGEVNDSNENYYEVTLKSYFNGRKRPPKIRRVEAENFRKKGIEKCGYFFLLVLCDRLKNKISVVEPANLIER